MLQNFMFAFNAIMPILLLMLLGYVMRRKGILTPNTMTEVSSFLFRFGLPCLLFTSVYSLKSLSDLPLDLMVFTVVSILLITLFHVFLSGFVTKDPGRRGVVIQTGFRSNYAIIGTTMPVTLYGTEGLQVATTVQAPGVLYFNVAAVICLTLFSNSDDKRVDAGMLLRRIAKNPLLIGLMCALTCLFLREFIPRTPDGELVFSFAGSLPFLYSPVESMGKLSSPMLLILMGGQIDFQAAGDMRREIIIGVIQKLILTPILGFGMALAAQRMGLLDLTPPAAASLLAYYGSPVAIAGGVMAENMNCDGELARQHIVWTSVVGMLTLFLWLVLLRSVGVL